MSLINTNRSPCGGTVPQPHANRFPANLFICNNEPIFLLPVPSSSCPKIKFRYLKPRSKDQIRNSRQSTQHVPSSASDAASVVLSLCTFINYRPTYLLTYLLIFKALSSNSVIARELFLRLAKEFTSFLMHLQHTHFKFDFNKILRVLTTFYVYTACNCCTFLFIQCFIISPVSKSLIFHLYLPSLCILAVQFSAASLSR